MLYVWVLLIAAVLFAIPRHADAQSRIALVIGNGTYQKVPALPNPLHDAQDVSDASYGIHGTAHPETIGKTASHGCVRLTNWDATELGHMVSKATKVVFLD